MGHGHQGSQQWLGLMAGNSKLHWARFEGDRLIKAWDSPHLTAPLQIEPKFPPNIPLYFTSVVPSQSQWIAAYGQTQEITLADFPLGNLYPTLGIDRALAVLGAGDRYDYPVLVLDGGTAITLTGADGDRNLVGGAILPGLQLQFDSLGLGTSALPRLDVAAASSTEHNAVTLPERWAMSTEGAIASGILRNLTDGLGAFISDWLQRYPSSTVVATGGSGPWIAMQLAAMPQVRGSVSNLGFCGISAWLRQRGERASQ